MKMAPRPLLAAPLAAAPAILNWNKVERGRERGRERGGKRERTLNGWESLKSTKERQREKTLPG